MKRKSKKIALQKKMAEYLTILKKDFDWDYEYILRLLQYKLSRTRKCIVSNNHVTSAHKIGKQIRQVESLIGRVIDNRYYDEISKDFHKKYGHSKILKLPHKKRARAVPITIRYERETPKNSRKIHQEASKLYKKAWGMKVRDLKKAFDLMSKNIWGWWD